MIWLMRLLGGSKLEALVSYKGLCRAITISVCVVCFGLFMLGGGLFRVSASPDDFEAPGRNLKMDPIPTKSSQNKNKIKKSMIFMSPTAFFFFFFFLGGEEMKNI